MPADENLPRQRTVVCRPWTALPLGAVSVLVAVGGIGEMAGGHWQWAAISIGGFAAWAAMFAQRWAGLIRLDERGITWRRGRERASVDYTDVTQILRSSANRFGVDVGVATRNGATVVVASNIRGSRAGELVTAIETALADGRRKPVIGRDRRSLAQPEQNSVEVATGA